MMAVDNSQLEDDLPLGELRLRFPLPMDPDINSNSNSNHEVQNPIIRDPPDYRLHERNPITPPIPFERIPLDRKRENIQ